MNNVACSCPRGMRITSLNMTSLTTNMHFTTNSSAFIYSHVAENQQRVASVWPLATLPLQEIENLLSIVDYSCMSSSIVDRCSHSSYNGAKCDIVCMLLLAVM